LNPTVSGSGAESFPALVDSIAANFAADRVVVLPPFLDQDLCFRRLSTLMVPFSVLVADSIVCRASDLFI
jgi:hypothetical protein